MKLRALDGGWGWMVAIASCVGHLCLVGGARNFGIIYVEIKEKFSTNAREAAWVISIYSVLRQVLSPATSVLAEKISCRWSVMAGGLLATLGLVLSAFTTNIYELYVTFGILGGLGGSLVFAPMIMIVTQYFDKKKGKAMALATIGSGLGGVILAPIMQLSVDEYGYQGVLMLTAGVLLQLVVVGALLRPLSHNRKAWVHEDQEMKRLTSDTEINGSIKCNPMSSSRTKCNVSLSEGNLSRQYKSDALLGSCRSNHSQSENNIRNCASQPLATNQRTSMDKDVNGNTCGESAEAEQNQNKISHFCAQRCSLLGNLTFLLYCFNMFSMPHAIQCTSMLLPALAQELGSTPQQAAMLLSISGMTDVTGRLLSGFLFDLQLVRGRRRPVHSGLGVILGIIVAMFALMPNFLALVAVVVAWGLTSGGFNGQRATILSEFVPMEQQGFSIGWITFSQGVGNFVAPTVSGLLFDYTGSYTYAYAYMGAVVSGTSLLFLCDYVIRKQNPPRHVIQRRVQV